MVEDPIVEETREARRQLDAEFGGDLDLLYAYLREIEQENADRVVRLKPKPAVAGHRKIS
jgi:hypothetical protein